MIEPFGPTFSEGERFAALLNSYCAADRETGALLRRSRGRSRGATHYLLVIPSRPPAERGGLFRELDDCTHRGLRAWDDGEAIARANAALSDDQAKEEER